ncbi:hypothetical protein T484DRAFT_3479023, partial [Baffinella frigidus]
MVASSKDLAAALAIVAHEIGVPSLTIDALRDALHAPQRRSSDSSRIHAPEEANQQKPHDVADTVVTPAAQSPHRFSQQDSHFGSSFIGSKSAFRLSSRRRSQTGKEGSIVSSFGESTNNKNLIWDQYLHPTKGHGEFQASETGVRHSFFHCFRTFFSEVRRKGLIAAQHRDIWPVVLMVLVVLLCAALGTLLAWSNQATEIMRQNAHA